VPTDLSALIQRREHRLQLNLTPQEVEQLDKVARAVNATSRASAARALVLSGIRELQAA
jgi:hypothetical protein